ncbi:hypothetical protein RFI_11589 [Reticulomyxa filosa]|uniref:Uncharacterized protein n=1 Tax=Reticulomyxa filosa TaxID=46433 RepID=X6NIK1_RETFI|nr:hypothetical protein RFI_11589 [Reticulomyxa filosa]|eukprot:ETO25549.1 hypothetical protein RFI_11589 [Reticulomyxa filosa]
MFREEKQINKQTKNKAKRERDVFVLEFEFGKSKRGQWKKGIKRMKWKEAMTMSRMRKEDREKTEVEERIECTGIMTTL